MPKTIALSSQAASTSPDYSGLVQFLVQPFLELPESLRVDCEQANNNQRVWIRLAFEGTDKGRVYGRGGRNIQAIRAVLETAAVVAGQFLYLDIYESQDNEPKQRENEYAHSSKKIETRRERPHHSPISKSLKTRSVPEVS